MEPLHVRMGVDDVNYFNKLKYMRNILATEMEIKTNKFLIHLALYIHIHQDIARIVYFIVV